MRNLDLEKKVQKTLLNSFSNFKGFLKSYEIFPVFILLKRMNKSFDDIVIKQHKESNLDIYRLLYRGIGINNSDLIKAFESCEDFIETRTGVSVHWPSWFKEFPIDTMTQDEFEIHFEQALDIARNRSSYGDFSTPKQISELLTSVYSIGSKAKVYNPFGGNASFVNFLPKDCIYFGNEVSEKTWALGILNLAAHNRLENSYFVREDAFYNRRNPDHFDFVISNPPFGLRTPGSSMFIPSEVDGNTIYHAMHQIAPNGKAAIVTATSFLSNGNQNAKGLRKELLDKDILEYVILLPAKLFQNTFIPCVAVFLNSKPNRKGGVTFIDASDFVLSAGKKDKVLDTGRLLKLIEDEGDSIHKRWVSKNEVEQEDYNFSVRRYLIAEEEVPANVKIVTLGEIAQERPKENPIEPGTIGRFIRIRDLKSDLLENFIKPEEIEITDVPQHAYEVKFASLLLALRFKTLKPTGIGFSGGKTTAFVSNEILSLRVDENLVDFNYLIAELNSDFVQKQVVGYQYGATIPTIRKKDVLNLKIRLPEKDAQRKVFNDKLESYYKEKDKELKAIKSQYNLKGEAFKEIASLKHSLGRPLLNIGSGIITIEALLAKTSDLSLKMELKKVLEGLKLNMDLTNNLLNRNEHELDLDNYKLEELDLISFINKFIGSSSNYSFKPIISVSEEIIDELGNCITVNSNKDLLAVLFNNIFDNAERHAFKGQKNDANELIIRVDLDTEQETSKVILSFKNNGLPFPENFDKEKFIRKNLKAGDTGNTGIGGYDIYRIVDFMQGSFDLKLNEDDRYATNYEIELPIIITKESEDEDI